MTQSIKSDRRITWVVLWVGLALLGWAYRTTFVSIVSKWQSDAAYGHGYLILPVALWLFWRKRGELAAVSLRPSWLGALAVVGCTLVWIVAHGSGVLVIEQLTVVAMISALVLAILGWPATRTLVFPLAFLFFAVPFGRGIVPWLMQLTADLSTLALQWSGIPVLRSHMYISIPSGNFEVAKACSGLKFFVAGLVLGTLYAHLTYRTWRKRLLCVAAFIVVPVLLNSARVYITIAVSHLTDMRFGPGKEHVTFGMIFFIVVMLVMFWVGRRWSDDFPVSDPTSTSRAGDAAVRASGGAWTAVVAALVALLLGPVLFESSVAKARARLVDERPLALLPAGVAEWQGPDAGHERWRPQYRGGIVERQAVYTDSQQATVDVFVAVYGLGETIGNEMISYNNVIDHGMRGSLAREVTLEIAVTDDLDLVVRELTVQNKGAAQLVWYWYVIGDRPVANQFLAKALEAAAFVAGNADSERIVALSTPDDSGARDRLRAFINAYGECVVAGFSPEACGG